MFNKSVDSVVKSLTKIASDLDAAFKKHLADGAFHQEQHIHHMTEANRALRVSDKLKELVG